MSMPPEVQEAFAQSYLGRVDSPELRALVERGSMVQVPAKYTVDRGDETPRLALVVQGGFRMFLASEDGRQVVIRYARPGDVMGTPALFAGSDTAQASVPLTVETFADSAIWLIPAPEFLALARRDPATATAAAQEVARRLYALMNEISHNAFDDVRSRLARHLLELAGPTSVEIAIVQRELADAVGSVREVIARILRDLREKKILESSPEGIVILSRDALEKLAQG